MVAEPEQRRFTLEEYESMIRAGILRSGERVELFDGRILAMAAMGGAHISSVLRISRVFRLRLPESVDVLVQTAIRLPPDAEPEPDVTVARHHDDDYASGPPSPRDILLLIEVADSSLAFDRDRKLPRYAAAGLPEAWLVDLPGDRIVISREPRDGRYTVLTSAGRGDTISPLAFPQLVIAVSDLLPPAAT
ncbi:MAG: Uma2 family endonuclease [Dehalococcoidia bacterium]